MRYRFVIENDSGDSFHPICMCESDASDERVSGYSGYATVEDAKATAQQGFPDVELKWKTPPASWGQDVVCVSQFVDDGVEANRDA